MKTILLAHAIRYPLMEPRDAVKLVYQNEFGGGHLIRNEQVCMEFLQKEYASVPQDPNTPLQEDIGNGLCRVNLAALDAHSISPEKLGAAFIHSAGIHRGCMESFQKKLSILRSLTCAGAMPFPADALENYLAEYEKAGCPPVSHSDTYRKAYHPAYRVVRTEYLSGQVL